jgi:hypothetical protein
VCVLQMNFSTQMAIFLVAMLNCNVSANKLKAWRQWLTELYALHRFEGFVHNLASCPEDVLKGRRRCPRALNLITRQRLVVSLFHTPVPVDQEAVWAPEPMRNVPNFK